MGFYSFNNSNRAKEVINFGNSRNRSFVALEQQQPITHARF